MSRYAVIADIHANFEALTSVLRFLEGRSIDRYVVCGDIVGYNANPNECVDLVRGLDALCVAGNHDVMMIREDPSFEHHEEAQRTLEWTRTTLTDDSLQFLASLKLLLAADGIYVTHATPVDPQEFYYVRTEPEPQGPDDEHSRYVEDIFKVMQAKRIRLCFYGHSHVPLIHSQYEGDGYTFVTTERTFMTGAYSVFNLTTVFAGMPFVAALVNVGSVGQPRDGNPFACATIYDSERQYIQQYRIPYDVHSAQRKIIAAGLPASLAQRLAGDATGVK
jgi:diadenosine tetraphosphatase ApaH/serine/threonine PP2A family protein phosphatase